MRDPITKNQPWQTLYALTLRALKAERERFHGALSDREIEYLAEALADALMHAEPSIAPDKFLRWNSDSGTT
jgi:hypothetical protein